ncbi:MAG TPA: hypothetical protein VM942_08090, partial [Acidimicrobiales bacterium]|nr:hypothetical protein [Acidimicrobiales bacterium]
MRRRREARPCSRRRWALLLVVASTFVGLAVAPGPLPAAGQETAEPTAHGPSDASEAGVQAVALADTPPAAVAAQGASPAGSFVTYRVFATQYASHDPASVEVAVPDKCAKFAAL